MTSRSARAIERALLSKGFRSSDTHHRILVLFMEGEPTGVRTFLSHGNKDYGDPLLQQVARQLCLSKAELLALIDCTLDGEDYLTLLRERVKLQ